MHHRCQNHHTEVIPATVFKQLPVGVIPGANPHSVLGSNHASLDANDYHSTRVIQRRQAVCPFLFAQHRVPDFNFNHGCLPSFISVLLHLLVLFPVTTANHRVVLMFRLSLDLRELST